MSILVYLSAEPGLFVGKPSGDGLAFRQVLTSNITSRGAVMTEPDTPAQCLLVGSVDTPLELPLQICGESIVSLRTLLKRYEPTLSVLINSTEYHDEFPVVTDTVGFIFPQGPMPQLHTFTPAPTNPVYTSSDVYTSSHLWFQNCYLGVRGSVRWRLWQCDYGDDSNMSQGSKPSLISGLLGASARDAFAAAAASGFEFLYPTNLSAIVSTCSVVNWPTAPVTSLGTRIVGGASGDVLTNTMNGMIDFEVPDYNMLAFRRANINGVGQFVETNGYFNNAYAIHNARVTSTEPGSRITFFFAYGDDASLLFYQNPPLTDILT